MIKELGLLRGVWMLVGLVTLAGFSATRVDGQISVIISASSANNADQEQTARMFSGQVTAWSDGSRVQLVDQSGTDIGKTFYETVLHKSATSVRKSLMALLLSGQIPKPEQLMSDDAVKAAVSGKAGSIGYIATENLDGSVKELFRIQ
jgi:ABC-type phosphate transport system substrate-binding protein